MLSDYLKDILISALQYQASDIHLAIDSEPRIRVNEDLNLLKHKKTNYEQLKETKDKLLNSNEKSELEEEGQVDTSFSFRDYRFRVNLYQQKDGLAIALRIIPRTIPSLKELKLPIILKDIIRRQRGLFLVTGPTGSGKSTTLASMIDLINERFRKHIITLEDPIEYVHQNKKSLINQRKVGGNTQSFAKGLRSSLRQDPDVIMVGEMRDLETISTAMTAAGTGHLVLATLHTNGASETIERIIDVFPAHQQSQVRTQLGLNLLGIVSQQLVPTIDNEKIVATEVLMANSAVKNLIREEKAHQIESIMQTNSDKGMHTMDYALRDLYKAGKIKKDTALSRAYNQENLKTLL